MKMRCQLTAEEVEKLITDELTRRGVKFSNLRHDVRVNQWEEPSYEGVKFDVEMENSKKKPIYNIEELEKIYPTIPTMKDLNNFNKLV